MILSVTYILLLEVNTPRKLSRKPINNKLTPMDPNISDWLIINRLIRANEVFYHRFAGSLVRSALISLRALHDR